jgi:hypothetical protein
MIAMKNKWSVSGAENGAEQAEKWVSGNGAKSGGHRKRWSMSGARRVAERVRSRERGF